MHAFDLSFTPTFDASGHNVTGITFDRPIPWPLFDGGPTDCPAAENAATSIQNGLDNVEQSTKAILGETKEALHDLCGEIDVACEGDLDSLKDGLSGISRELRQLRGVFEQATRKVGEGQVAPTSLSGNALNHERLVRRSLALELLLNPDVVDLIADAISTVDAAEKHLLDAVTDLKKESEKVGHLL
jgi:hypothetical protein